MCSSTLCTVRLAYFSIGTLISSYFAPSMVSVRWVHHHCSHASCLDTWFLTSVSICVKKYSQSGSKGKSEFHRVSFRCAAVNSLKGSVCKEFGLTMLLECVHFVIGGLYWLFVWWLRLAKQLWHFVILSISIGCSHNASSMCFAMSSSTYLPGAELGCVLCNFMNWSLKWSHSGISGVHKWRC